MSNDWIIGVLGDLRGFARTNDLPALAKQLEEALVTAELEIGAASPATRTGQNGAAAERFSGTTG